MEAIILAGGFGTRLSNVVQGTPKCLAPVANKPFLHWLINNLLQHGFTHFIFSVGYLKEQIIQWAQDNLEAHQYKICIEHEPLGTGGGIQAAMAFCQNINVFALNGDTFYNNNFQAQLKAHNENNAICTLALKPMQHYNRYGSVITNSQNIVTNFTEKVYTEAGNINAGVYCINKQKFLELKLPEKFSFENDFLVPNANSHNLGSIVNDGYFIDIGIPEDYTIANSYFLNTTT